MKRVALVQGASRGLGLALVARLLALPERWQVVATSRLPHASDGLGCLARAHGSALQVLPMDVCDETAIAAAASEVGEHHDRLHLVVNCAGLLHDEDLAPEKKLLDVNADGLGRAFQVNAQGPVLVAKHFLPLLKHEERAVLLNVSARVGSIADNRLGGWYAYRASKAAQNMLTRTLSVELRRRAPRVICAAYHPGTVDTALSEPFQRGVPEDRLFSPDRAAGHLLDVVDKLAPEDTGSFVAWDGSRIPW